jgi:neutral ceramidase
MSRTAAGTENAVAGAELAGRLYAGTAKVDITPPLGIPMCGYAERTLGAQAIHDPLFARVVVLTDGRVSLALVASDLVWLYSPRIVEEARKRWGLDHVVLCGSHTHSGPIDAPSPWHAAMEDKVIAAIGEAKAGLFAARIGAGKGTVDASCFGYNRRFVKPDGTVEMWWNNSARKPNGPTDPTVRVIRIDDESGRPRAVLAHHAAHSVVLGSGNVQISADYPGATVARIEEELGKDVMAMFFQGGGGDVHPYDAVLSGDAGFAAMERAGKALGEDALRIFKSIKPQMPGQCGIQVRECVLALTHREDQSKTTEAGVMAVVVNNDIALAVVSGEPFVQHQLDLAAKSPVENTFLLGYAFFGKGLPLRTYLPSDQAARVGGYGAAVGSANFLEIGAGEKMVGAAAGLIKELKVLENTR